MDVAAGRKHDTRHGVRGQQWWCSGSQNISINRYITTMIYFAEFPTAHYQVNTETNIGMLGHLPIHFTKQRMII
jgi:hypothetical protein